MFLTSTILTQNNSNKNFENIKCNITPYVSEYNIYMKSHNFWFKVVNIQHMEAQGKN